VLIDTSAESVVERIEQEYRRRTPRSAELFQAANVYIPGGASRSLVVFHPYPLCMTAGQGAHFTDIDGHDYIDFVNCHSALVHGHAHPAITAAIQQQAARGPASSAASEDEAALARLLCERVPSVQKVRFCSSGTEAAMYAIRIARAFTGRDKILKFEGGYHGSYDDAEISKTFQVAEAGPPGDPRPVAATLGFPRGTTDRVVVAPFNDREVVSRRIHENKDALAAVLVEPVVGAGGMIPPEDGFLPFLRQITREHGIVLIADEVVTFRLAYAGAQALYDFEPDLTMFGKVIGGGLPVAAVGGRDDLLMLSSYDLSGATLSRLSLSGTFSGAAIGMAAGRACLGALDAEAIQRINGLGELMRQRIGAVLLDVGIGGRVTGVGSLLQLHFTDEPVREYRAAATAYPALLRPLHLGLLNRGIAMYARGAFNISTVMTEQDVSVAAEALREALWDLKPYARAIAPRLVASRGG
jgi:glutamate-1-semialdehyde 2,1-aminomutase